jgi:hypothetical protein
MTSVDCSLVIVDGPYSVTSSHARESEGVLKLNEQGLIWLENTCTQIQKAILGKPESSLERIELEKQMACLRIALQRQINLGKEKNGIRTKAQALANSILQYGFVKFSNALLNYPDTQAHVDCLLFELTRAFDEKDDVQAVACLVHLEDLLLNSSRSHIEIRQFSIFGLQLTTRLFGTLYRALTTGDYVKNPVTELYSVLQKLSPQVLAAFCRRLQEVLPLKLASIHDISSKIKILFGIIPPPEGGQADAQLIPEEIRALINQLVVKETSALIKQLDAPTEDLPLDCTHPQFLNTLKEYFCCLEQEDLLARLVCHVPLLQRVYQCHLVTRLTTDLNSLFFPEDILRRYIQFAKENIIKLADLPDDLARELQKAFDQYLVTTFTNIEQKFSTTETIFREAELCKTMRDLFSISGAFLSQDIFEKIKKVFIMASPRDFTKIDRKEAVELIGALPLSKWQKECLVWIVGTVQK